MPRSIPDGWKDYKPIGKRIEGTRFIAFKVPLKEHILKRVDSETHLDGNALLKMIPNLGLIIDLTNTNRFYDPKIFENRGIEHKKLMTPGHETPSKHLRDKFIVIVKEFLEKNKNNDKLIGVHCTHGVNRTGYMICNYMISQMTIEPNEALDKFANARGHKIERKNYINNLQNTQETKTQNVTAKQKREPENWRARKVDNVQPENWRQQGQGQRIENYHKEVPNRQQVRCEEKYNSLQSVSRAKSPLSRSNRSRRNYSRSKSPLSRSHPPRRTDYRSKSPLLRSNRSRRNYSRSKSPLIRINRRRDYSRSPISNSYQCRKNDSRSKSPLFLPSNRCRKNSSRSKSPLSSSHYSRRSDSFSRPRTTDIIVERPRRNIVPPTEGRKEQLRCSRSVSHQTSSLRVDYYNKRPVSESQHNRDLQRRTYLRPARHS